MKIEKHKVVLLSYALETGGIVADEATADRPLDYIHGMHMLLPRFEEKLEGLETGASFDFTLSPEEGYGAYDENRRKALPKAAFTINGELREDLMTPGRTLPLMSSHGEVIQAVVAEVRENDVLMDFNHPMAGKSLHFTGTVLSVRDATEKELAEGLHGEFLPPEAHHCHCGGDGCHCHGDGEGHCCHDN